TSAEATMTIVGAIAAAGAGGWGLSQASRPAWWWATFAVASGLALAVWGVSATAVMSRPSSASDEIELGWDDLIRFMHVRSMTISAAWMPAVFIFLADWEASSQPGSTSFWPSYLILAVFITLCIVYRQGRTLWRRAWLLDGNPH